MIKPEQNFPVEEREAQVFEPIPENVYQVELLDVDVQDKPRYQKPEEIESVFSLQFVILGGKDKDGASLRGRNIWLNFVPTYFYISSKNGKNKLYQAVEALLGRELSREEVATFEAAKMNKLIAKQCRVVVKNKPSKDGKNVFSNIDSLLTAESQMPALTDEEKDKSKVKKEQEAISEEEMGQAQQIDVSKIPF